jgi:hypothetical protein
MAKEPKRVVVLGDTVFLLGVQASLAACPGLEVFNLEQPLEKPFEVLSRLRPDAVIFDLEVTQPDFLFSLLQQPGLLLIGVDPETHRALVWSRRQAPAAAATDLIGVIQQKEV